MYLPEEAQKLYLLKYILSALKQYENVSLHWQVLHQITSK